MSELLVAIHIFWWSAGLLVYTWFGYPILLAILERVFYRPVARKPQTPPITILMTVYNEEDTIAAKLDNLLSQEYPQDAIRIVVASDGSTDQTNTIVGEYASRGVVLHAHHARRGKAAVLNDEVPQCETELVVLCDARQRLASDALARVVADFSDADVGAVSGELVLEEASGAGIGRGMGAYWRYEKFLRTRESAIHSSVGATGALLALRRYLWRGLPANTILDDMVFPFQVVQQGYRVILESGALVYDQPNETWEREFVRKTRTLAGNFQSLFHPVSMSVPLFNVLTFQYFSHKALRLLGPLLLLMAFWGNYWAYRLTGVDTGHGMYAWLLAAQGGFYAVCLLGFIAERLRVRIPFVHIPYSFFITQVAIVCGFLRFGSGRDSGAWDKVSHIQEDGHMQHRLLRLLFDSTLFCLGIIAAFRIMGSPEHLFRLFADLNPQFSRGSLNMSVPLVILVPLTILYFFRVNEATSRLSAQSFLNIVKGVFHCTVVMLVLLYMMRGHVTLPGESGITSLLPTKVLALSFCINILAMVGWRLVAGWIEGWRAPSAVRVQQTLCVQREVGATSEVVHGGYGRLHFDGLSGWLADSENMNPGKDVVTAELETVLKEKRVAGVCACCGRLSREETLDVLNMVEREGWKASFLPTELEMLLGTTSLSLICYIPVLDVSRGAVREFDIFCKRTMDLFLAGLFLFAGLPGVLGGLISGGKAAFVCTRKAGTSGVVFPLWRPSGTMRSHWWRRGARRFFLGWAILRGYMSAVGQPALSESLGTRLSPFERNLLSSRPGIVGPRRIQLVGMGHVRPALYAALFYNKCKSLQLDCQFLSRLFFRAR